jgi:hypothetical protein
MRRFHRQTWSKLSALLVFLSCTTCGGKSGGVAAAIACSLLAASINGSSLTLGLSETLLGKLQTGQNLTQDTEQLNIRIQNTLNSALAAASLDSQLQIKSVTAVPKDDGPDDGVRFLELGGTLAPGVSFASSLLQQPAVKEALNASLGLDGQKPFDFVEDSFRIYATGRPAAGLTQSEASAKQWAYAQTRLDEAQKLSQALPPQKDQVVVAVIDTGVDLEHPALQDNLYRLRAITLQAIRPMPMTIKVMGHTVLASLPPRKSAMTAWSEWENSWLRARYASCQSKFWARMDQDRRMLSTRGFALPWLRELM